MNLYENLLKYSIVFGKEMRILEKKSTEFKEDFNIKKGDIFKVKLTNCNNSKFNGIKNAIVIQSHNKYFETIAIAIIDEDDSKEKIMPTRIKLNNEIYKLDGENIILVDQIKTVEKECFIEKVGSLNFEDKKLLNEALLFEFGFVK